VLLGASLLACQSSYALLLSGPMLQQDGVTPAVAWHATKSWAVDNLVQVLAVIACTFLVLLAIRTIRRAYRNAATAAAMPEVMTARPASGQVSEAAPARERSASVRRESAWHEAGHLVTGWVQPDFPSLPIRAWVARQSGAGSDGAVHWPATAARRSPAPATFAWVVMCLGGRGGELLANGSHTTVEGPVSDVSQAAAHVRDMRDGLAVLTLPGQAAQIRWSEVTDAQVIDIAADHAAMIVAAHAEAIALIGQALLDAPDGLSGQELLTALQEHLGPKATSSAEQRHQPRKAVPTRRAGAG